MKIFASAALIAIAASSQAFADDLSVPTAYPSSFNWNGAYIGGHVGWAGSRETVTDIDGYNAAGSKFSNNLNNAFGGAQAGYNFTSGNIVYGLEAEFGYLSLQGSKQYPPYVGVRSPEDSVDSTKGGLYGTIAGRLGLAVGPALVYGKVGWGIAEASASFTDTDPTGTVLTHGTSTSGTLSGAVYGGGVEFAMSDTISVKVEYLRFDFGDTLTNTAVNEFGESFRFAHQIDPADTVKIGFNIKLDRPAAPVEPLK